MVSYETVRRAADLRKRRPKPHTTWHLDEVYLKIAGRMVYLWRAVDAEGEVLDVLVQSRRNKRAALKLMRKLLKKYGFVPDKLVTDDLRSYVPLPVILESQDDMSVVDGATIEPRIRINRPDDENTRRRVSSVRGQPKDFSQLTQPSTTLSTSNVISLLQGRTEPFAPSVGSSRRGPRGLQFARPRRHLGGGRAADVTLRRAVALDLTLLFLDAAVLRFRDFAIEGVDIVRLRWFAAPDLTLARPKAPQIARRAL